MSDIMHGFISAKNKEAPKVSKTASLPKLIENQRQSPSEPVNLAVNRLKLKQAQYKGTVSSLTSRGTSSQMRLPEASKESDNSQHLPNIS